MFDGLHGPDSPHDPDRIAPDVMSVLNHPVQGPSQHHGFPQQLLERKSPVGVKGIDAELEIPKEMGETELVAAVGDHHEMRSQPVAHPGCRREERTQESLDDLVPPAAIHMEEGGKGIAEHPELRPLPGDPRPRLVALDDTPALHFFTDLLVAGRDAIRHPVDESAERALAHGKIAEIL